MKLTKDDVSQTFNLKEIFGVSFDDKPELREAIAQAFIDAIVERTEDGFDRMGNKFKGYSKAYIESDEFKDYNKTPSKVNMTLTGSMLDSLDIRKQTKNTVKIGFDGDESKKAYNHNVADTIKTKREFFGLTKAQVNKIKKKFSDRIKQIQEEGRETLTEDQQDARTVADFINNSPRNDQQLFDDIFGGLHDPTK